MLRNASAALLLALTLVGAAAAQPQPGRYPWQAERDYCNEPRGEIVATGDVPFGAWRTKPRWWTAQGVIRLSDSRPITPDMYLVWTYDTGLGAQTSYGAAWGEFDLCMLDESVRNSDQVFWFVEVFERKGGPILYRSRFPQRFEVNRPIVLIAEPASGPTPLNWVTGRILRRPTHRDILEVYPKQALRDGLPGEAVLTCTVEARGALTGCEVTHETPGSGFGAAALKLATRFRVRTDHWDLTSNVGKRFQVRVEFSACRNHRDRRC